MLKNLCNLLSRIEHVIARRRALRRQFDVNRQFHDIEETCVPSYLHRNPFAAGVAWSRLFFAVDLYREYAMPGVVLDFGAGAGELAYLLPNDVPYEFVESDDAIAAVLLKNHADAVRRRLSDLPERRYAAVFALDSLEHNEGHTRSAKYFEARHPSGGVLVVSGPTENFLYRCGRKLSGFRGHYHKATIYDIERLLAHGLVLDKKYRVSLGLPLFLISVWRLLDAD